jgi:CCR4-NOT complex subunit CAF16
MTASQPLAAVASVAPGETQDSVVVRCLDFSFPGSQPVIQGLSLELPRGARCLLTGANGAGKDSSDPQPRERLIGPRLFTRCCSEAPCMSS